jgi:hypothetical protein
MSEDELEIRMAVKKLLRVCKLFQARAMSRETALKTIIQLPPSGRASLTGDDVRSLLQEARQLADVRVSESSAALDRALETGTRWQDWLEAYTFALLKKDE